METMLRSCEIIPETGELSVSIDYKGPSRTIRTELPDRVVEKIIDKMWCRSWEELQGKIDNLGGVSNTLKIEA